MRRYYINCKLLLTGEYLVLDGANALALPTKLGQSMEVTPTKEESINWTSFDHNGNCWLRVNCSLSQGLPELKEPIPAKKAWEGDRQAAIKLVEILQKAHELNPAVLEDTRGFEVVTHLDFDRSWGLGSSSTLINNIAQWFEVDPYLLLQQTFGGSGYDIASANNNHPITFTLNTQGPRVFTAAFNPSFKNDLFFVHLNRKQNSRHSIAHYKNQSKENLADTVEKINSLTDRIIASNTLAEFELLLDIHETLLSNILHTPKVKSVLFEDYPRTVKSLGGWGGDFVLATGGEDEKQYFRKKGYHTIITYTKLVF